MTVRERTLVWLLFPPLVLAGGAFLGHQLWYGPLQTKDKRIADLGNEIDEKEIAVAKAMQKKKELAKYKQLSLPADTDLARREYEEELSKLFKASGFEGAGAVSIVAKPVDSKSSPTLQKNKPPIYTRLAYNVTAKGELLSLVDFLEKFYGHRLLHQIRNLKIARPSTSDRNRTFDLDITMTIEALVLDVAEHRKTLMPEKPPEVASVLAGGERKYDAIAGRDLFFGPPPPPPAPAVTRASTTDFAQFIKFDGFTDSEKGPVITLFDAYNNQETLIRPRADGEGHRVEVTYLLNNKRKTLRSGKTIDVLDEQGEIQHRWLVLKTSEREVFLQDEDSYFVLRIGQRLSDMSRLTVEEAASFGLLPVKEPEKEKTVTGEVKEK